MIAIPNMGMPDTCDMCPIEGCEYINGKFTCPLIDIVRCGECKWFINEGSVTICDMHEQYIEPTDFCSYGERRADEGITE